MELCSNPPLTVATPSSTSKKNSSLSIASSKHQDPLANSLLLCSEDILSLRPSQDYGDTSFDYSLRIYPSPSAFGLTASPIYFIIFTSSFAAENYAIEKVEDQSNLFLSFIKPNSSIFENEDLYLHDLLSTDANVVSPL